MIVIGTLRTRIIWSTAISGVRFSPKSCFSVVCPITTTFAAPVSSLGSNVRPETIVQSRTSKYSGVAP